MRFRRIRLDPLKLDWAIAALLAVGGQAEVWLGTGAHGERVVVAIGGLVVAAAVAVRRRYPATAGIAAALVGDVLARRMGWKAGDRVRLESGLHPELPIWEFTIAGTYDARAKNIDRSWFVMHWSYLNDALAPSRRDHVGWITSRVDDRSQSADASGADSPPATALKAKGLTKSGISFVIDAEKLSLASHIKAGQAPQGLIVR